MQAVIPGTLARVHYGSALYARCIAESGEFKQPIADVWGRDCVALVVATLSCPFGGHGAAFVLVQGRFGWLSTRVLALGHHVAVQGP